MKLRYNRRWLQFTLLLVGFTGAAFGAIGYYCSRPDYLFSSAEGYFALGEQARQRQDTGVAQSAYEYADQQLRRLLDDKNQPGHGAGLLLRYQVLTRLAALAAAVEAKRSDATSDRRSVAYARSALQCAERASANPQDARAQGVLLMHYLDQDDCAHAAPFAANLIRNPPADPEASADLSRYQAEARYVLAWVALHVQPPRPEEALLHLSAAAEPEARSEHGAATTSWRRIALEARAARLQDDQARSRPRMTQGAPGPLTSKQAHGRWSAKVSGWLDQVRREAVSKATPHPWDSLTPTNARGLLDLLVLSIELAEDGKEVVERARLAVQVAESISPTDKPNLPLLREAAGHLSLVVDQVERLPAARRPAQAEWARLTERMDKIIDLSLNSGAPLTPAQCLQLASSSCRDGHLESASRFARKGLQAVERAGRDEAKSDKSNDKSKQNVELALHAELARALLLQGKTKEAETHLTPLRDDAQHFAAVAHFLQGLAAARERRPEEAVRELQKAAEQPPFKQDLQLRVALAHALADLGKYDRALAYLLMVQNQLGKDSARSTAGRPPLERNPSLRAALNMDLFRCHLALDRVEQALSFKSLLPAQPEGLTASVILIKYHLAMGQARQNAGKMAEAGQSFLLARQELTAARKLAPDDFRLTEAEINWLLSLPESALALVAPNMMPTLKDFAEMLRRLETSRPGVEAVHLLARPKALSREDGAALLDYFRGRQAQGQGNHRQAVQSFERSLACTTFKGQVQYGLLTSLLAIKSKEKPEAARDLAMQLLWTHPGEPVLLLVCADCAVQLGKVEGVEGMEGQLKALEFSLQRQNQVPLLAPFFQGWGWLAGGRPDLARRELERALVENPQHVPSLWLAGQAALGAGDWRTCLDYATRLEKLQPQWPEPQRWRALALSRLQGPQAARNDYQTLLNKYPDDASGYRGVIAAQEKDADFAAALALAVRWQERLPEDPDALQAEVRLLAKSKKPELAQQRGEHYLGEYAARQADRLKSPVLSPRQALALSKVRILSAVAQGFREAGQREQAENWAQRALVLCEEGTGPVLEASVAVRLLLGDIYLAGLEAEKQPERRRVLVDRAIDVFEWVWKRVPGQLIAGNNLAWLLARERGQTDRAVAIVQQVRARHPGQGFRGGESLPAEILKTAGAVYNDGGQFDEAAKLLQEGMHRYPNNAHLILQLGRAQQGLKKYDDARASLNSAVHIAEEKAAGDTENKSQWLAVLVDARKALAEMGKRTSR